MDTAPTTDQTEAQTGTEADQRTVPIPLEAGWVPVVAPGARAAEAGPSGRKILVQLVAGLVVVLVVVTLASAYASRRLAEREAVNDAANTADVLAQAVVQPALSDELFTEQGSEGGAFTSFDQVVRERVLGDGVVRVRIWDQSGRIVYSDQSALVGRQFDLEPDELEAIADPTTVAEVSDLSRPENALDRRRGEKLLEVYRPVWTPSGQTALFEIYLSYDQVGQRTSDLWRGFAGVTMSSLLLLIVLMSPLLVHLVRRARRAQRQRELLLERAVEAGAAERRRIAASLHDGPVQELAAGGFVVAGAQAQAESAGAHRLAGELAQVSGTIRSSIRALRSLLVDLYPPSLSRAGLVAALGDLAQSVRAEGLRVDIDLPASDPPLDPAAQRAVFRVAQEALRNAAEHATPCLALVSLRYEEGEVVLEVTDDGPGFDAEALLDDPAPDHFGLRLLADAAAEVDARLDLRTAPHQGTTWRLTLSTERGGEAA